MDTNTKQRFLIMLRDVVISSATTQPEAIKLAKARSRQSGCTYNVADKEGEFERLWVNEYSAGVVNELSSLNLGPEPGPSPGTAEPSGTLHMMRGEDKTAFELGRLSGIEMISRPFSKWNPNPYDRTAQALEYFEWVNGWMEGIRNALLYTH